MARPFCVSAVGQVTVGRPVPGALVVARWVTIGHVPIRGPVSGAASRRIPVAVPLSVPPVRAVLTTGIPPGTVGSRTVATGTDVTGTILTGTGTVLTAGVLTAGVLTGSELTRGVLTGTILLGRVPPGAILRGTVLTGPVLTGTVLTSPVLTSPVLTSPVLTGTVFVRPVLTWTALLGAVLSPGLLGRAALSGIQGNLGVVTWPRLSRAAMIGTVAAGAVLLSRVMSGTVIVNALTGARLTGSGLAWLELIRTIRTRRVQSRSRMSLTWERLAGAALAGLIVLVVLAGAEALAVRITAEPLVSVVEVPVRRRTRPAELGTISRPRLSRPAAWVITRPGRPEVFARVLTWFTGRAAAATA
jgi:uncharacterized protein YjbI with pentapeptide repeats